MCTQSTCGCIPVAIDDVHAGNACETGPIAMNTCIKQLPCVYLKASVCVAGGGGGGGPVCMYVCMLLTNGCYNGCLYQLLRG